MRLKTQNKRLKNEIFSLLEYSADRGNYQALSEVSMPTESSVMLIKSHKDLLFVSLLEGDLLMYHRPPGSENYFYLAGF